MIDSEHSSLDVCASDEIRENTEKSLLLHIFLASDFNWKYLLLFFCSRIYYCKLYLLISATDTFVQHTHLAWIYEVMHISKGNLFQDCIWFVWFYRCRGNRFIYMQIEFRFRWVFRTVGMFSTFLSLWQFYRDFIQLVFLLFNLSASVPRESPDTVVWYYRKLIINWPITRLLHTM